MIKLVVTDMDGTLLDDGRNLPKDIWNAIDQLHKKGILFAVASGRQYQTLADIFAPVADKMLFMAENGTYIVNNGQPLSMHPLPKKLVDEFIDTARNIPDCHIVLCGTKAGYVESNDPKFLEQAAFYFHHREIVSDLKNVDDEVLKFTVCDFGDPAKNSYKHFEKFLDVSKPVVSSHIWLDIMTPDANKGTALETMLEKLGISNEETIVFGDYMNDFEMMQFANNSYAMANAHPEILKIAKFVTANDNNNNGVLETLRTLELWT